MAGTPPPSPKGGCSPWTDSPNALLFIFDGPGDTTRRPARPNLPPPDWFGWRGPPYDKPQPPPKE
jgi:hypothetical protein